MCIQTKDADPGWCYLDPDPTFEKEKSPIRPSKKIRIRVRIRILPNFYLIKLTFTFFFRHKSHHNWYFNKSLINKHCRKGTILNGIWPIFWSGSDQNTRIRMSYPLAQTYKLSQLARRKFNTCSIRSLQILYSSCLTERKKERQHSLKVHWSRAKYLD